jgi:hypothetical protein
MDALFKIASADFLDKRTKKAIASKLENVVALVSEVEAKSGIPYPPYYVEPVLTVAESSDNMGGLGVMYARTIPIEANGAVQILVELSAPLVLYATKKTLRLVIAHELLHYVELVRNFTKVYEERHTDYSRAIDPSKVFSTASSKTLVRDLNKKTSAGLDDQKLNEKCRTRWIEKKMPVARIPLERNQVHVSVEAIMRSTFEPSVVELVSRMT